MHSTPLIGSCSSKKDMDHEKLSDLAAIVTKKVDANLQSKANDKAYAKANHRIKGLLNSRKISGSQGWLYVFPSEYNGTKFDSNDFCALLRYN